MDKQNINIICSNCVMDTTDTNIIFDEKGVCDHCNTYYTDIKPNWHTDEKGWNQLQSMAEKIKKEGQGKDFDCLLGMSGGVDSSYLLYLAKEKLGLKPLVFHVDAGWNSPEAVNNIEVLVERFKLDLYTQVINWEEMKDLQLSFFKSAVPHIDTPQDHAFFATMYKFADKYNIRYILTGANYSTECIRNPKQWMYFQSDSRQIKSIHRQFGTQELKEFPFTNIIWHKIYLRYFKKIQVLSPLNFIPYTKKEAIKLLTKFDWQAYPQKHFESRFTRFYESYWFYEKFGYDVRKVQFSSLILTGQMAREDALTELKKLPYDKENIKHDFEFVANKLGISVAELQTYFEAPNKIYKDYKNQEGVYSLGAYVLRLLGIEKGGKR